MSPASQVIGAAISVQSGPYGDVCPDHSGLTSLIHGSDENVSGVTAIGSTWYVVNNLDRAAYIAMSVALTGYIVTRSRPATAAATRVTANAARCSQRRATRMPAV